MSLRQIFAARNRSTDSPSLNPVANKDNQNGAELTNLGTEKGEEEEEEESNGQKLVGGIGHSRI